MEPLTIEQARARLTELIRSMAPGREVVITRGDRPVARPTVTAPVERKPRRLGALNGTVLDMAPDFDEPLDDFEVDKG